MGYYGILWAGFGEAPPSVDTVALDKHNEEIDKDRWVSHGVHDSGTGGRGCEGFDI